MATIPTLLEREALCALDGTQLIGNARQVREILFSPLAFRVLEGDLQKWTAEFDTESPSPFDQFKLLMRKYLRGANLVHGTEFHIMTPEVQDIWEMKTIDIRLTGWFPSPNLFICTNLGNADIIKAYKIHDQIVEEAIWFRDNIDLTEPKYTPGANENEVL